MTPTWKLGVNENIIGAGDGEVRYQKRSLAEKFKLAKITLDAYPHPGL